MKIHRLYLLLGFLMTLTLFSCAEEDEDDDKYGIGTEFNGSYLGIITYKKLDSTTTTAPQKVILKKALRDERVDLSLPYVKIEQNNYGAFVLTDVMATTVDKGEPLTLYTAQTIEQSPLGKYTIQLKGDITNGVMTLEGDIQWEEQGDMLPSSFTFEGSVEETPLSSAVGINSISLPENIFMLEASTSSTGIPNAIFLGIRKDVDFESLTSVPVTLELPEGATCTPESGLAQNLTKPIYYTVTSEDGVVSAVYRVEALRRFGMITFDNWIAANPKVSGVNQYQVPDSVPSMFVWNSTDGRYAPFMHLPTSNPEGSIAPLKPMSEYGVQPTTDAVSGKAAKIITQMGEAQKAYKIPAIIPGVLYTGRANFAAAPSLQCTYGVPLHYKAYKLKGYYKYTRGKQYYECVPAAPYEATKIDKRDQFYICVVVYKVNNRFDDSEMLTYAELMKSKEVIGRGEFFSDEEKSSYTTFEIPITYSSEFSYKNNYRIALFFTPSKEQDIYAGAPGSTLYLDDVELVTD